MAASVSADRPMLALAEALDAVDVAMRAGDTVPMSDEVRAELTDKWLYIVGSMANVRARTPRGRRTKAIVLQKLNERMQPKPSLFVDLALSLARDLATPLKAGA